MPRLPDILPARYYHDHFTEMCDLVLRLYGDMFGPSEEKFLRDFRELTQDAQCLFLRICNRKKEIFHPSFLCYGEIDDCEKAIGELKSLGWLRLLNDGDYQCFLHECTKTTLLGIVKSRFKDNLKPAWKKDRVVDAILANIAYEDFCDLHDTAPYFTAVRKNEMQFFLYLYFGKTQDSLTAFALRDFGLIGTNPRNDFSARFRDMEEARAGFFYSSALRQLKSGAAEAYTRLTQMMDDFPSADTPYIQDLRDRTLYALGLHHERKKDTDMAVRLYRCASSQDCRERLIRLLYATGLRAETEHMLEAMIGDPASDDEYIFAVDFLARKFKKQRVGVYTNLLRESKTISVDDAFVGAPEQAALNHFKESGWIGYHCENFLWNALFGLVFWDELFESEGAMGCGFDVTPTLLRKREFFLCHETEIRKKLTRIDAGEAHEIVMQTYTRRQDTPNGVFGWWDGLDVLLNDFLRVASASALSAMLEKMARDYHSMCDGYPDLLLIKNGHVRFTEIKAQGDQIRRTQLVRMEQLRLCGFDVDILQIAYHVDPDQVYVVVDVETTGGQSYDRITEIGAVKIRNGEIVAEWQSLINPQRHISSFITQLTGITNDMVRDAPLFPDIAEELADFLDGAVFAAHNVNFDYGFIGAEFRRAGYTFKMPKICTCASMRRHFPGSSSYGLKHLCAEYGVGLETHHRALCDARAAAQLLMKINEKRLDDAALKQAA